MNRLLRVLLLVALVMVVTIVCVFWSKHSRERAALTKFKTELRAKGEKLTAEELGYPRPPENRPGLDRLLAAAKRIELLRFQPSSFDFMPFSGPGQVERIWSSAQLPTHDAGTTYDWETITAQFIKEQSITLELREAVQIPPLCFYNDPTNFFNAPKGNFVGIRAAAQWLAGDMLVAARARRVDQVALDIHALSQLAQFHREDHALVSQMIRVAVAGLGLSVTWQGLQAEGWNEALLTRLQKDWEAVNLADSFETGMLGERARGEAAFAILRTASSGERYEFTRLSTTAGPVQRKSAEDYFEAYVVMPFWGANADADETVFLQHHQRNLDSIRKLHTGVPWAVVDAELNSNHAVLNNAFRSPISKYRYLLTTIMTPSYLRVAGTCVRSETQRRMTVTGIALERHRLRSGVYPPNLEALVPEFLSARPIDLMSAKPFCYRRNADGTFTLYSIGEDGRDDGGDATSGSATTEFDFWSGRDAVWPLADTKK